MKQMRQAVLRHGTERLVAWVEDKCKVGNSITLKNSDDPEQLWEVVSLSENVRPLDEIKQTWRVGGL